MASSSSKKFSCTHQCGCNYTAARKGDLQKHIPTKLKHRSCTSACPHYTDVVWVDIKMESPESFREKLIARNTPSMEPGPTIETVKILCILDPSRREKSYNATVGSASWVTLTDLSLGLVQEVLECGALAGYVFRIPGKKDAVRIYDWVSTSPFILLQVRSDSRG